jgi:type IV pilus assembly protein PilW
MMFNKQKGLTLIELMIAMLLSLVITYAAFSIMVSNNQTANIAETASQSQDNGRFAISFLSRQITKAGYSPIDTGGDDTIQPFADICDSANISGQYGMCTSDDNNTSGDGTSMGDRLTIIRTADNARSCFGSQLKKDAGTGAVIAEGTIVTDAFWVAENNGVKSLYCQTFEFEPSTFSSSNAISTAQPITAGIAAMHILYGQSTEESVNGSRNVTAYLAANELNSRSGNDYEKDWEQVYSVRLSILTESFDSTARLSGNRDYILLDAAPYTVSDQISRQVFSTTITRANF